MSTGSDWGSGVGTALGGFAGSMLGPLGTVGGAYAGNQLGGQLGGSFSQPGGFFGSSGVGGIMGSLGLGNPTSGPFSSSNYQAPMTPGQAQGYASGYMQSNGSGTSDLNSLYSMLSAQANGQGPNLAQAQAMQQGQNANKMFLGALAGNRGMSPGLAMQMAGQQAGQYQGQAIQQGAQATLAQQLAAQQQMGQVGNQLQQNSQFNANSYNQLLQSLYGNASNQNINNNNTVSGVFNNTNGFAGNGVGNAFKAAGTAANGIAAVAGMA